MRCFIMLLAATCIVAPAFAADQIRTTLNGVPVNAGVVACTNCSGSGESNIGTNGATAPTSSGQVGYVGVDGLLHAWAGDNAGHPIVAPPKAASTPTSGTVTTANTYQSILAANASRNGCLIQNTSPNSELAFLGAPGSATAATSIVIPTGGSLSCNSPGLVITDQISLTSAVAGSAFVVVSQ